MEEVAHELQAIKRTHEESVEAQREYFRVEMEGMKEKLEQMEGFRMEMENVTEKLGQMEVKSARLEREIGLLKAKEQGQQLDKDASAVKKNQAQSKGKGKGLENSTEPTEEEVLSIHSPRSRGKSITPDSGLPENSAKQRSYATVAASKPAQASDQSWTKVSYGNRKTEGSKPSIGRGEQRGRRILFPRKDGSQLKSEADLMLALNEALQKGGVEPKIRFTRVRYAPSESISALLTEKADAAMLLPQRSNLLIRAAKSVDNALIGVKVLEQWQRLNVHGMLLERYLGLEKMELLRREVESSTGISLKTMPCWLINKNRLREEQEINNKRGSAIVITVSNENEAKQLVASGLRFGGSIKRVEKFWDAGPGSVCMKCCGIGHERLGNCGNRLEKCVICAGDHAVALRW